jgi:hypothetical protein
VESAALHGSRLGIAREVAINVVGNLAAAAILYVLAVLGGYIRGVPGLVALAIVLLVQLALSFAMGLFGGFKYITSGGDSGNMQSAKNTVVYGAILLFLLILEAALAWFVSAKPKSFISASLNWMAGAAGGASIILFATVWVLGAYSNNYSQNVLAKRGLVLSATLAGISVLVAEVFGWHWFGPTAALLAIGSVSAIVARSVFATSTQALAPAATRSETKRTRAPRFIALLSILALVYSSVVWYSLGLDVGSTEAIVTVASAAVSAAATLIASIAAVISARRSKNPPNKTVEDPAPPSVVPRLILPGDPEFRYPPPSSGPPQES